MPLYLYNGGLLVRNGGLAASQDCCCSVCDELLIIYDWSGTGQNDLDTGTTFLGATVGYAHSDSGQYISWGGDNTGNSAQETANVFFRAALNNGAWTGSVTVQLAAGWYSPAGGSGPITIRVRCANDTTGATEKTKTASPGSQTGPATTPVGSVTILENGSFTLN